MRAKIVNISIMIDLSPTANESEPSSVEVAANSTILLEEELA